MNKTASKMKICKCISTQNHAMFSRPQSNQGGLHSTNKLQRDGKRDGETRWEASMFRPVHLLCQSVACSSVSKNTGVIGAIVFTPDKFQVAEKCATENELSNEIKRATISASAECHKLEIATSNVYHVISCMSFLHNCSFYSSALNFLWRISKLSFSQIYFFQVFLRYTYIKL